MHYFFQNHSINIRIKKKIEKFFSVDNRFPLIKIVCYSFDSKMFKKISKLIIPSVQSKYNLDFTVNIFKL